MNSYRLVRKKVAHPLALPLPIAWNLLRLRTIAQQGGDEPAETVLSSVELDVLRHAACCLCRELADLEARRGFSSA